MTKAEFEKRVRVLVGSDRGWKTAAAEKLGVSERAMRDALAGRVGPKVEKALVAAEFGAEEVKSDGWGPLIATAGAWAFGVPETKSRDPRVVGEILLTHLATPYFVVHVVMRDTGLADIYADMLRHLGAAREMQDLSVHFQKYVRWFEEPSSPARRAQLLEMAFQKAEERLRQDLVDVRESAARDAMVARVKEQGTLDEMDARGESMAALATAVRTGSDRDLKLETAKLERESAELLSAHTTLLQRVQRDGVASAGDVRRAFDLGERRGRVKSMLGWCFQASMHIDGDIGRLIVARIHNRRPVAHKTRARGTHRKWVEIGQDGSVAVADAAVMLGVTGTKMHNLVKQRAPAFTKATAGRAKRTRILLKDAIDWLVEGRARDLGADTGAYLRPVDE